MKTSKIKRFWKNEDGVATLIEASIYLPVAMMIVFFLIYMGLYILQSMTLASYAQKVAFLAAREVACPGYSTLLGKERYETSASEADFRLVQQNGEREDGKCKITIDNKVASCQVQAYRYWTTNGDKLPKNSNNNYDAKSYYEDVLRELVKKNSIINAGEGNSVTATIHCENHFISQYIYVDVEQQLMRFPVLDFFNIRNPSIKASAVAVVNDTDELVRNTDFAVDSIEALAEYMGIDVDGMKDKVDKILKELRLIE